MRRTALVTSLGLLAAGLVVVLQGTAAHAASSWSGEPLGTTTKPTSLAADDGHVWVAVDSYPVYPRTTRITRIDAVTGEVEAVLPVVTMDLWGVSRIAVDDNRLYLSGGGELRVLDATTGASLGTLPAPSDLHNAQLAVHDGVLYVGTATTVRALDAVTGVPVAGFSAPAKPSIEAIAADADGVWISQWNGGLTQLDPDTGAQLRTAPAVGNPVALAADGGALYVGQKRGYPNPPVVKLDSATGDPVAGFTPPADQVLYTEALAASGGRVYATDESLVAAFAGTDGEPVAGFDVASTGIPMVKLEFDLNDHGDSIALAPDGAGHVYTASRSAVIRVSTATGRVDQVIPTAPYGIGLPGDLALDGEGHLYVIDRRGWSGSEVKMLKLDLATGEPVTGFEVDPDDVGTPLRFALDGDRIFLLDHVFEQNRIVELDADTGALIPGFLADTRILQPGGMAADGEGNLYVADRRRTYPYGGAVFKFSTTTGKHDPSFVVTTATARNPDRVAVHEGVLYVTAPMGGQHVGPQHGVVAVSAATGVPIPAFDAAAVAAGASSDDARTPYKGVAVEDDGTVLVADPTGLYELEPGAPTAPDAPAAITGTTASGAVTLRLTAPADNGGAVVTGYDVTASPGGATCHATVGPGNPATATCTVTGLTNGTTYRFSATASNSVGTSAGSARSTSLTPGQPNNVGGPRVAGTARVGQTLTCVVGYPGSDAIGYRWLRDGKAIAATSRTYVATPSDLAHGLSCRTSGHNQYGWTYGVASAPVKVAVGYPLKVRVAPKVTVKGTHGAKLRVGNRLTVSTGSWTPRATTVTYQWLRGYTRIPRATNARYIVTKADRGKRLTVRVTASRTGYSPGDYTTPGRSVAG